MLEPAASGGARHYPGGIHRIGSSSSLSNSDGVSDTSGSQSPLDRPLSSPPPASPRAASPDPTNPAAQTFAPASAPAGPSTPPPQSVAAGGELPAGATNLTKGAGDVAGDDQQQKEFQQFLNQTLEKITIKIAPAFNDDHPSIKAAVDGASAQLFDQTAKIKLTDADGNASKDLDYKGVIQEARNNSSSYQDAAKAALTKTTENGGILKICDTTADFKTRGEALKKISAVQREQLNALLGATPPPSAEEKKEIETQIATLNAADACIDETIKAASDAEEKLSTEIAKKMAEGPDADATKNAADDLKREQHEAELAKMRSDHRNNMTKLFLNMMEKVTGMLLEAAQAYARLSSHANKSINAGI